MQKLTFAGLSRTVSMWMILLILAVGSFFSAVIPPFQSPDEFDHIKRAYLLTTGTIIAPVPTGQSSGGMIDTGLNAYMSVYEVLPFKPERKLTAGETAAAKNISWTGVGAFSPLPGISYYFPVIYLPQAAALGLGEKLKLRVDTSYRLARFFVLVSIAILLWIAFNLYPANPMTVGLLVLPMALFQLFSASLDGISMALAILAITSFMRIVKDKENANPWLFYALSLSACLIATSRPFMVPIMALVFAACLYMKKKRCYYVFTASAIFVIGWLVIAMTTTVDNRVIVGASTSSVVLFYVKNPLTLLTVFLNTLTDASVARLSVESFLGRLGWLDAPFERREFIFLSICFVLIGLLSVSVRNLRSSWVPRFLLLFTALASMLLIFLELLVAWTPHPARIIDGVQGRYFYIPTLMVAYALSGDSNWSEGLLRKTAIGVVIILGFFSLINMPRVLLERYYISPERIEQNAFQIRASAPLDKNHPVSLFMSSAHIENGEPLKRLGVRIGTYMRRNQGVAELRLTAADGHVLTRPFTLNDLADNQYHYFELDSKAYVAGRMVYSTGGGVSVWEAHDASGAIESCLIYEYVNGKIRRTQGCP